MKIRVVVLEVELPRWVRTSLRVVAPVAAVVATGAVLATPKQWSAGETLAAGDLNGLSVLTVGSKPYSVGATHYCGVTPPTTGALSKNGLTSWAAAKAMCEAVSGCGATAHMCESSEVVRSLQVSDAIPTNGAWYATGLFSSLNNSMFAGIDDCAGWGNNSASHSGMVSYGFGGQLPTTCSNMLPVLCCD